MKDLAFWFVIIAAFMFGEDLLSAYQSDACKDQCLHRFKSCVEACKILPKEDQGNCHMQCMAEAKPCYERCD